MLSSAMWSQMSRMSSAASGRRLTLATTGYAALLDLTLATTGYAALLDRRARAWDLACAAFHG